MYDGDEVESDTAVNVSDGSKTREIRGFYAYQIAAEVYAVVGVGAFLPVLLEQLARQNGVLFSDRSTPCVSHADSQRTRLIRAENAQDSIQCIVNIFGANITTASFAMYTFSLATLCQAVTLVSTSSFADYGKNRTFMLYWFGAIGSITCWCFLFVPPLPYLLAPILVVIGVTCLGCSFVVLNSFLPLITTNLGSSTKISARAVGLGYAAALFVQLLSIGILSIVKNVRNMPNLSIQLVLLLTGIWWGVFDIIAFRLLRKRYGKGSPFPEVRHEDDKSLSVLSKCYRKTINVIDHVSFAWKGLYNTLRTALRIRDLRLFLLAWFILSDATASVSGTAILFARTELQLSTIQIALLSITAMLSGIFGSIILPRVSTIFGWSANSTIIACLILMEIIPLYGLLAYIPMIQSWGVGGLQQKWEIFPLAFVHGVVMAGISSYCRSLWGQMLPQGQEAAFFALFAVTDKGSSAVGPAVVGRIVDKTGSVRSAFWFLAVVVLLPMPLIRYVNAERGQENARAFAVKASMTDRSMALNDVSSSREVELALMHEAAED